MASGAGSILFRLAAKLSAYLPTFQKLFFTGKAADDEM